MGRFAVNTRGYSPVPAFGSIWVVLWLLFLRSAPSTFPLQQVTLCGVCFWESLVFRLYSVIDQIHLSIEAQYGTACLPMGDCHTRDGYGAQQKLSPFDREENLAQIKLNFELGALNNDPGSSSLCYLYQIWIHEIIINK